MMLSLQETRQALQNAYATTGDEVEREAQRNAEASTSARGFSTFDAQVVAKAVAKFTDSIAPQLVQNGNRVDIEACEEFFSSLGLDPDTKNRISQFYKEFPKKPDNVSAAILLDFLQAVDVLARLFQENDTNLPAKYFALEILLSPLSDQFVIARDASNDFRAFRETVTNFFKAKDKYEKIIAHYITGKVSDINLRNDSSNELILAYTEVKSFFPKNAAEVFSVLGIPEINPATISTVLLQRQAWEFLKRELSKSDSIMRGLDVLDLQSKKYNSFKQISKGFATRALDVLGGQVLDPEVLWAELNVVKIEVVDKSKGKSSGLAELRASVEALVASADKEKKKAVGSEKLTRSNIVIADLYAMAYETVLVDKSDTGQAVKATLTRRDEKYRAELKRVVEEFIGRHSIDTNAPSAKQAVVMFTQGLPGADASKTSQLETQRIAAAIAAALYAERHPQDYGNILATYFKTEQSRKELNALWRAFQSTDNNSNSADIARLAVLATELSRSLADNGLPLAVGQEFILRDPNARLSEDVIGMLRKRMDDFITAIELWDKKAREFLRTDPQLIPGLATVSTTGIKLLPKDIEAFNRVTDLCFGADTVVSKTFELSNPELLRLQGEVLLALRQAKRAMDVEGNIMLNAGVEDFVQATPGSTPSTNMLATLINRLETPQSAKELSELLTSMVQKKDKKPASSMDSKILGKGGFLERAKTLAEADFKLEVKERKNIMAK